MKVFILLFTLILSGCATTQTVQQNQTASVSQTEVKDIPFSRKVYFFQHKVIPNWVYGSNGDFYEDLSVGKIDQFIVKAATILGQHYANEIAVESIEGRDAILITFPEPSVIPNCFYVIIEKTAGDYRYITYEQTLKIPGSEFDYIGVVGSWGRDGGHDNYGSRTYSSAKEFVVDVLGDK